MQFNEIVEKLKQGQSGVVDFKIKKEENVFPMIPSGQSVNELLEESVDGN